MYYNTTIESKFVSTHASGSMQEIKMVESKKIQWSSKDGKHALAAWIKHTGAIWWCASIDGVETCILGPNNNVAPDTGAVAAIGRVGLTQERLDALKSSVIDVTARYDLTPDGLEMIRRRLQGKLEHELDLVDYARERAFAEDIGKLPSYESTSIAQARQALADFDAEHPEIAASIAANKAEAAFRALNLAD